MIHACQKCPQFCGIGQTWILRQAQSGRNLFVARAPAIVICSMAKNSCADRTILVANLLTNTCVLELAVVHRLVSRVGVVCGCEICKHLLLCNIFYNGRHFSSKGAQNTREHLSILGPLLAVVHRLVSRVGVVCGCEMCKHLLLCNIFYNGRPFSSKRGQNRREHLSILGPSTLLHTSIPRTNMFFRIRCLKHMENMAPKKAKGSKLGEPPCILADAL